MRYPGAKQRMLKSILPTLEPWLTAAQGYIEPFLGSGAVARAVLPKLPSNIPVILADLDPWIISYWRAASQRTEELTELVTAFIPSVDSFLEFRDLERSGSIPSNDAIAGFQKLALHAMSWGGLGVMSGSPIGGITGQSIAKYKVGCRWNPKRVIKEIKEIAELCSIRAVSLMSCDFLDVLTLANADWVAYIDPPYWSAGPGLYKLSFSEKNHEDLASKLQHSAFKWALSYDNDERVRNRYSGFANISEICGTTQRGGLRNEKRQKTELLLSRSTLCGELT